MGFPGCIMVGVGLGEAWLMAAEALTFHVEGIREDGTAIPEPNALGAVMADPGNSDAVGLLVECRADRDKAASGFTGAVTPELFRQNT